MTTPAILMMIVALLIVGGGLAGSITYLLRRPLDDEDTAGTRGPVDDGPR